MIRGFIKQNNNDYGVWGFLNCLEWLFFIDLFVIIYKFIKQASGNSMFYN